MDKLSSLQSFNSAGELADLLVAIFDHVATEKIQKVAFDYIGNGKGEAKFYSAGSTEPCKSVPLHEGVFRALHLALNERAFLWPDSRDNLFATNTRKKRILLSPVVGTKVLAELVIEQRKDRRSPSLVLDKISSDGLDPILDRLVFSESTRAKFDQFAAAKSGLVIASQTATVPGIDAAALCLALHPEASFYTNTSDPQVLEAAICESEHRIVVVLHGPDDPIDAIYDTIALLQGKRELELRFFNNLLMAFSHRRVKRVCGNCARITAIGPTLAEKVPQYLLPSDMQSYMFGRGCPACGHAAYRGTVGLDSVVWLDSTLRKMLERRATVQQVVEYAHNHGWCSLMEDGIFKITRGYTSFEEVLNNTRRPPESLAAILISSRHKSVMESPPAITIDSEPLVVSEEFFVDSPLGVNGKPKRAKPALLLIEDDPDQLAVLELVFKTEGYEVLCAESALAGLKTVKNHEIDVIVTDFMMPEMNGEEMILALKANPIYKNIPVLMLTAVDTSDQELSSLEKGADDYCPKTTKRKILVKRVENLLKRTSGKLPSKEIG